MLEKIQEGIGHSKIAYSDTLHNLELISDDIHRSRQEKARHQLMIGQRGEGVGAEHDTNSIPHDKSMDRIRRLSLDQVLDEDERRSPLDIGDDDTTMTGSISSDDEDTTLGSSRPVSVMSSEVVVGVKINPQAIPSIHVKNENNNEVGCDREAGLIGPGCDNDNNDKDENSDISDKFLKDLVVEDADRTIKENVKSIDSSYDVITSHSIKPSSPDAIDMLPGFDFTDSGHHLLNELNQKRRARSMVDLSSLSASESGMMRGNIVDISKSGTASESNDNLYRDFTDDDEVNGRDRSHNLSYSRKSSSFSFGVKPKGYASARDTPESRKRNIAMLAALTIPSILAVAHQDCDKDS